MSEDLLPLPKTDEEETLPEENSCPNITMQQWIEEGSEVECRPCKLGPVVQWYRDELQERGQEALATKVEGAAELRDPAAIAALLDEIKSQVDEPLALRLKEFDCAAQTSELEEKGGDTNEAESQGH